MVEELARQSLAPEEQARIRVVPVIEDEAGDKDELKPGLRLRGGFEDVMRGLMRDEEGRGYPRMILFDASPSTESEGMELMRRMCPLRRGRRKRS